MKLALCLIVKPTDQEADYLKRCLENAAPYVDKIFITITGNNERVENTARLFNAEVSRFEWINDFAAARNYNFSQVPKDYDYILWLDADDMVRGIENLKDTIEKNPTDAYSLWYLYSFDEWKRPVVVHHKTRVVRNDGSVEWAGKLHEDFKKNRQISVYHIKDIEVLHLTDEERIKDNRVRNVEVARGDVAANPDDPRSWWNLGNSLKGAGQNKEAIEAFDKFLESSQSDDEKYIVRLRRAESYWALGEKVKAIDEARYAIGIKPEYPDAYHLLGSLYFEMEQLEKARDSYLMGLTKRPPYYSIIVFNPRDYDYTPLMNLAKTYFRLSLPTFALECLKGCLKIYPKDKNLKTLVGKIKKEAVKFEKILKLAARLIKIEDKEKLRKELDKIPEEFQSHPAICNIRNVNFIKEKSSGKDLVFYCGYTEKEWSPDIAQEKGVGGSEEAVIHLAELLADKGWNVSVYCNCGYKELKFGKVAYKPFWSWNYRDKQDAVVIWRVPRPLDYDINADRIFVDLHDVINSGELTPARVAKINKIFVKSQFHRSCYPDVPEEKFAIIGNGIKTEDFNKEIEKDPYLIINTSSSDRSLSSVLDIYEKVKERVPQAKLKWAYGWGVFDVVHSDNPKITEWKAAIKRRIKDLGVEELGMINHKEIAELYLKANVFLYPSEFAEISCISAMKAQAAGAIPITSDFAALEETVKFGFKVHSKKTKDDWAAPYQFDFAMKDGLDLFVDKTVDLLSKPNQNRKEMREWAKGFNWENVAQKWNNIISGDNLTY